MTVALFAAILAGALVWWWTRGGAREDYAAARRAAIEGEARKLHAASTIAFAGVHDYREATAADWRGLDRRYYDDATAELEREGFAVVADLVDDTMHRAFPQLRTVLRVLLGDGGRVRVAVYHVRAVGRLRLFQLVGLVPRRMKLAECVTELEGSGRMISTASSRGIDHMSMPDSVLVERLPPTTSAAGVLARHRARLGAHAREVFVVMQGAEDMLRSVQRSNQIIARHREGLGPLSSDELRALAGRPLGDAERELLEALQRTRPS